MVYNNADYKFYPIWEKTGVEPNQNKGWYEFDNSTYMAHGQQ